MLTSFRPTLYFCQFRLSDCSLMNFLSLPSQQYKIQRNNDYPLPYKQLQARNMICSIETLINAKKQRKEKESDLVHFQFPNQLFRTKLFQDSMELNKDILRLGMKYYFRKGRVFIRDQLRNLNGYKITYKCRHSECSARLVYHKKPGSAFYDPVIFQNLHQHARSKDPLKAKRQDINLFTMQLKGEEYEKYRKIPRWVEKFDVTNGEGLWIVEQLYWFSNIEDENLIYLAHQNIIIRRLVEDEQSLIIFLATQSMRKNYLLYGETITIETHTDTGKKRAIIENHAVGFLFGQNQNMGLVLLGIFMIAEESKAIYKKIFQFFIETVTGNVMPTYIISDRKQDISDALDELKAQNNYSYNHLYPWYHMTRNFMDTLKKVKNKQKVMQLMCEAMQETNQKNYSFLMSQLKDYLKQQPEIFDYFVNGQNKYCLRRIPIKFSGFAISTSFGKTVIGQVTDSAVYRAHSARFFTRLLKIQRDLINSSKKLVNISLDVIRHFPEQITTLWKKLEINIMKILITNYNNSKDCELKQDNNIEIKVTQKNGKQFLCKFLIEYDHWQCECHQLERTGMPCSHLLRILLDKKYEGSLFYYINSRWFHSKEENKETSGPYITNKVRTHFTCFV